MTKAAKRLQVVTDEMTDPIRLPMPPSNNHYKQFYCTRSTPRDVHKVRAKLTERAESYKAEVGWLVKNAGVRMTEKPYRLWAAIYVYPSMTDSHLDIDNIPKVVFDALNGIAWEDDTQVEELHVYRMSPVAEGCIEIVIGKIPKVRAGQRYALPEAR